MKCPKCVSDLLEFASPEGVVVDFCGGCKGMFFDTGEVSAYLELAADFPDIAASLSAATPTDHRCPKCSAPMQEVPFYPGEALLLDRCGACGGVWFDAREIPRVERIASRVGEPVSKVMRALRFAVESGYGGKPKAPA